MQRLFRASFCTLIAENALRPVPLLVEFLVDFHVHWADPQAFAAIDAFALITMDTQK